MISYLCQLGWVFLAIFAFIPCISPVSVTIVSYFRKYIYVTLLYCFGCIMYVRKWYTQWLCLDFLSFFFFKGLFPLSRLQKIFLYKGCTRLKPLYFFSLYFFSFDDVIHDFLETLGSTGILWFASFCFGVHDIQCPVTCFVWFYLWEYS